MLEQQRQAARDAEAAEAAHKRATHQPNPPRCDFLGPFDRGMTGAANVLTVTPNVAPAPPKTAPAKPKGYVIKIDVRAHGYLWAAYFNDEKFDYGTTDTRRRAERRALKAIKRRGGRFDSKTIEIRY